MAQFYQDGSKLKVKLSEWIESKRLKAGACFICTEFYFKDSSECRFVACQKFGNPDSICCGFEFDVDADVFFEFCLDNGIVMPLRKLPGGQLKKSSASEI